MVRLNFSSCSGCEHGHTDMSYYIASYQVDERIDFSLVRQLSSFKYKYGDVSRSGQTHFTENLGSRPSSSWR